MKAKRRYLTKKEAAALSEKQGHVCFIEGCGEPIAVWEHWAPVALGNDQKPDCGLCAAHADAKTYGGPGRVGGDIRDIAHVKRLIKKRDGPKKPSRLKSGGFRGWRDFSGKPIAARTKPKRKNNES